VSENRVRFAEQTLLRRDGSAFRHTSEEVPIEAHAIDITELFVCFNQERLLSDMLGGMNHDGKSGRLH